MKELGLGENHLIALFAFFIVLLIIIDIMLYN